MQNFKRFMIALAVMFIVVGISYGQETKKVLVAGFVNQGDKTDDSINTVMSKSFITFLNMLAGSELVSYKEAEKLATDSKYWSGKSADKDIAIRMGQQAGADQVITGEYTVKNEKITVKIYVYDTATKKQKLNITRKGDAGMDIFDTIDAIILDVTGLILGKKIVLAKLNVTIKDTDNSYFVTIAGKTLAEVSKNNPYSGQIFAETAQAIGLRSKTTGREVYIEMVNLKKGEEKTIDYTPSGTIKLKIINLEEEADIFINENKIQKAENKKTVTIPNIPSGKSMKIEIISENKELLSLKNITIDEGKELSIELDIKLGVRRIFIPVSLMGNALLGGKIAVDYFPIQALKLQFGVNINYIQSSVVFGLNFDTMYYFLPNNGNNIAFGAGLGISHYFIDTAGNTSLSAILAVEYWKVFFQSGVRLSFNDGTTHPIIELGFRL